MSLLGDLTTFPINWTFPDYHLAIFGLLKTQNTQEIKKYIYCVNWMMIIKGKKGCCNTMLAKRYMCALTLGTVVTVIGLEQHRTGGRTWRIGLEEGHGRSDISGKRSVSYLSKEPHPEELLNMSKEDMKWIMRMKNTAIIHAK